MKSSHRGIKKGVIYVVILVIAGFILFAGWRMYMEIELKRVGESIQNLGTSIGEEMKSESVDVLKQDTSKFRATTGADSSGRRKPFGSGF